MCATAFCLNARCINSLFLFRCPCARFPPTFCLQRLWFIPHTVLERMCSKAGGLITTDDLSLASGCFLCCYLQLLYDIYIDGFKNCYGLDQYIDIKQIIILKLFTWGKIKRFSQMHFWCNVSECSIYRRGFERTLSKTVSCTRTRSVVAVTSDICSPRWWFNPHWTTVFDLDWSVLIPGLGWLSDPTYY